MRERERRYWEGGTERETFREREKGEGREGEGKGERKRGKMEIDRKSTRLNSSHVRTSRMPSSA